MARHIIRIVMATLAVALAVTIGALAVSAQEATPPPADANQLFVTNGVDAPILAQADVADLSLSGGVLLLERIELPTGSQMSPHTTAATELLYVETGTLAIQDSFGFATLVQPGSDLSLNADVQYTIANQGTVPASVLRFRLTGDTAPPDAATPIDLTGTSATPVSASVQPAILIQAPIAAFSPDASMMFLARATFSANTDSGKQGHTGPIGLYIEDGSLNVVSPSGLQGTIGTGQGVSLPAETPLQASTGGDEATALIIGVVEANHSPFAEVTPEPTATPLPTKTPVPTATTVPTATPMPTATAEPTPIPSPTAIPTTESGSTLQLGETWTANDALITVTGEYRNGPQAAYGVLALSITYTNTSDSRLDGNVSPGSLRVYDDRRETWGIVEWSGEGYSELINSRLILDPGESRTIVAFVEYPDSNYAANVFIVFEHFGSVDFAKWGLTWDSGRILTIPPDAVDPTESGQSDSQEQASTESQLVDALSGPADISSLVTNLSPPEGMVVANQGALGAEEITASFSDPESARVFFEDWGWQQNAFVYYEPPGGGSTATGLVYVDIGIHRFLDADGASQALDYFANVRRDQMLLADLTINPLGDQSRAIMGETNMGTEASVYARIGTVVIRVSVMSVGADPLGEAFAITEGLVANLASVGSSEESATVYTGDLTALLPVESDVPEQLVFVSENNRTLDEVAANYDDPAQITALFTGWGWQGNVNRAFQMPSGVYPEQAQINGVYISIHAFGSPQDAVAALDYSLTDQATSTGASEVASPDLGDYSRALMGQESYGNEVTLLVQRGNLMIRVSAAQLEGDPTPTAVTIMQGILARVG